jgi:hypothetical protein
VRKTGGENSPLDRLVAIPHGAEDDLGVEVVGELGDVLRLDRELLIHHRQVVLQFRVVRDDDALAVRVVLGPTGSTEHLQDVLTREFDPATLLRVVDLGTLDDDDVRGQVDTPSEGRGRDEHLDAAVAEQVFDEGAVDAVHSGVVDTEPERQEVLQVRVADRLGFRSEDLARGGVGAEELRDRLVLDGGVAEELGRLGRLLARVDKDDDLVLAGVFEDFFVTDLVRDLEALDRLLLGDADELLLERARAVRRVKVEETLFDVDLEEPGHVLVVGQGRRETDEADIVVRLLHAADRPCHDRLEDRTTLVVQQVDLVDDDQRDEVRVTRVGRFARDDVPLFRRRDNDLGLGDLLLRQLAVAREFIDGDAERLQALVEVADHLLHEGLHRRDVDNLERRKVKLARPVVAVLGELVQDRQHGDVGLARTGRGAEQQRLVSPERDGVQSALDSVQGRVPLEGVLRPLGQVGHGDEFALLERGRFRRRDVHLLVTLLGPLERPLGEFALLVRHESAALRERHRFEVERLARRRSGLARLEGALGGAGRLDDGVDVHVVIARRRRGGVSASELFQDPPDALFAHRDLDVDFFVVRTPRQLGAPDNLVPVRDQGRDEFKLVVLGQVHQAVFDVAHVAFGREERHRLFGLLRRLERVRVRSGKEPLQPEAVDLARGDLAVLVAAAAAVLTLLGPFAADDDRLVVFDVDARDHLVVVDAAAAGSSRTLDALVFVVRVGLFIADFEPFVGTVLVIFVLVVKHDRDSDVVVNLALGRAVVVAVLVGAFALLFLVAIVGDAFPEGRQLGKLVVRDRSRQERLDLALLVEVLELVVFEVRQDHVGGRADHGRRRVAEQRVHRGEDQLVHGARLGRARSVVEPLDCYKRVQVSVLFALTRN